MKSDILKQFAIVWTIHVICESLRNKRYHFQHVEINEAANFHACMWKFGVYVIYKHVYVYIYL